MHFCKVFPACLKVFSVRTPCVCISAKKVLLPALPARLCVAFCRHLCACSFLVHFKQNILALHLSPFIAVLLSIPVRIRRHGFQVWIDVGIDIGCRSVASSCWALHRHVSIDPLPLLLWTTDHPDHGTKLLVIHLERMLLLLSRDTRALLRLLLLGLVLLSREPRALLLLLRLLVLLSRETSTAQTRALLVLLSRETKTSKDRALLLLLCLL